MGTKSTRSVGELLTLFAESIFPHLGYKVDDVENDIFYAENEEDGRFIWVLLDRGDKNEVILSFSILFVPWDEDSNPKEHFESLLRLVDNEDYLDGWWNEKDGRLIITYELSDEECTEDIIQNTLEAFYKVTDDFCADYLLSVLTDQIIEERKGGSGIT